MEVVLQKLCLSRTVLGLIALHYALVYRRVTHDVGKTSSSFSIRIPKEVKEKMKDVDIDWPCYLRTVIENKTKEAKRKNAAASMDRIRSKTKPGSFDSTKSIREARDA